MTSSPVKCIDSLFNNNQQCITDPTIFYRVFDSESIMSFEKANVLAMPCWSYYVQVDKDFKHPCGCLLKMNTFFFSDCPVKIFKFLVDYENTKSMKYEVCPENEMDVIAKVVIPCLEDIGNSPDGIKIDKERPLTEQEDFYFIQNKLIQSNQTEPLFFGERDDFIAYF